MTKITFNAENWIDDEAHIMVYVNGKDFTYQGEKFTMGDIKTEDDFMTVNFYESLGRKIGKAYKFVTDKKWFAETGFIIDHFGKTDVNPMVAFAKVLAATL